MEALFPLNTLSTNIAFVGAIATLTCIVIHFVTGSARSELLTGVFATITFSMPFSSLFSHPSENAQHIISNHAALLLFFGLLFCFGIGTIIKSLWT